MMRWFKLNMEGRILYVACIINLIVAAVLASSGQYSAIFSGLMAAFCNICSYNERYQIDGKTK